VTFPVAGRDGIPAGATDVLLNVTASAETTAGGFVTHTTTAGPLYAVNSGFWAKGQQVTNLVMMGAAGDAVIDNTSSGSANFTADAVGYYTFTGQTSVFIPATPRRLVNVKINGRQTVKLTVVGGAVPTGATAVAVNLTASGAAETNTITAYADGTARQGITSLSYESGVTTENATVVAVGSDGAIDLDNNGTKPVTVAVDLTGSYYAY
jgi:hypothetical protein